MFYIVPYPCVVKPPPWGSLSHMSTDIRRLNRAIEFHSVIGLKLTILAFIASKTGWIKASGFPNLYLFFVRIMCATISGKNIYYRPMCVHVLPGRGVPGVGWGECGDSAESAGPDIVPGRAAPPRRTQPPGAGPTVSAVADDPAISCCTLSGIWHMQYLISDSCMPRLTVSLSVRQTHVPLSSCSNLNQWW